MNPLPPWATGPFELILHAEGHLRNGNDFDRRIALISFDDAIEVAITTYLSLHPIQRNNRTYSNMELDNWLQNYHSKLDFLEVELKSRSLTWIVARSHIVWAHDHRNEQYHGGNKGTPEKHVLDVIRRAAIWVFSVLFEVPDPERVLEEAIAATAPAEPPQRDSRYDRAIDGKYGLVDIAGEPYYTSELLFGTDKDAYRDLGNRLCSETPASDLETKE